MLLLSRLDTIERILNKVDDAVGKIHHAVETVHNAMDKFKNDLHEFSKDVISLVRGWSFFDGSSDTVVDEELAMGG